RRGMRHGVKAGFVHVKARPGIPGNWPPSSSTRTNGVSGFAMAASVLSRAARRTSSTQAAGPSEGVGPRVRIRLAPAESLLRTAFLAPTHDPKEAVVAEV